MKVIFVTGVVVFLSTVMFPNEAYGVKTYTTNDTPKDIQTETKTLVVNNWSDEIRSLSVAEPSLHTNERIDQLAPHVPEIYKDMFDRISRVLKDRYMAQTLNFRY